MLLGPAAAAMRARSTKSGVGNVNAAEGLEYAERGAERRRCGAEGYDQTERGVPNRVEPPDDVGGRGEDDREDGRCDALGLVDEQHRDDDQPHASGGQQCQSEI